MSTTVGKIVLDVDADGRLLERRIRNVGRRAGAVGGKAAGDEFAAGIDARLSVIGAQSFKRLRERAAKEGKTLGQAMGLNLSNRFDAITKSRLNRAFSELSAALFDKTGFVKFAKDFENVDEAVENLTARLNLFREELAIDGNQIRSLSKTIREWGGELRESQNRTRELQATESALSLELKEQAQVVKQSQREYIAWNREKDRAIERENTFTDALKRSLVNLNRVRNELEDTTRARFRSTSQTLSLIRAYEREHDALGLLVGRYDRFRAANDRALSNIPRFSVDLGELALNLDGAAGSMLGFDRATQSANKSSASFFSRWKVLPRGFRRFTFFTALFAALGENIAVLGSAAGSSLAVLAGSIQQLGSALAAGLTVGLISLGNILVIVGLLVTAFRGFTGELSDLPPQARAVATVFRGLAKPLSDLRKLIQEGIFDGLAAPLQDALTNIFPAFQTGAVRLAEVLNRGLGRGLDRLASPEAAEKIAGVFSAVALVANPLLDTVYNLIEGVANIWIIGSREAAIFSEWLSRITGNFVEFSESAEGQNAIADWFRRGRETLTGFLEGVIDLGAALGNIFDAGRPQIDRFNEALGTGLDRFRRWTESAEGQNALVEWFSNGERVVRSLTGLLVTAGKTLNEIVDDQAIRRFESTISAIESSLPGLGELLEVLGGLNIFGGIAAILDNVLSALNPIFIALQPIADLIGNLLIVAVEQLGVGLSVLATVLNALLGPSIKIVADVLNFFLEEMNKGSKVFRDVINLFNDELAVAFEKVGGAIANLILEILGVNTEGASMTDWLQSNLVPFIETKVVPAIQEWSDKLVVLIDKFRTEVLPYIRDVFVPFLINDLIPAIQGVIQWGKDWGAGIDRLRDKMAPLLRLALEIASAFGLIKKTSPSGVGGGGSGTPSRFLKTGGVLTQQRTIAGEAGVELVVPLTRPLSQVDSSVRELSAIARQLYGTTGRTEGPRQGRQGPYVAPGAITVVSPYANPAHVAVAALDELVERMG